MLAGPACQVGCHVVHFMLGAVAFGRCEQVFGQLPFAVVQGAQSQGDAVHRLPSFRTGAPMALACATSARPPPEVAGTSPACEGAEAAVVGAGAGRPSPRSIRVSLAAAVLNSGC